jgi:hypothetical protein
LLLRLAGAASFRCCFFLLTLMLFAAAGCRCSLLVLAAASRCWCSLLLLAAAGARCCSSLLLLLLLVTAAAAAAARYCSCCSLHCNVFNLKMARSLLLLPLLLHCCDAGMTEQTTIRSVELELVGHPVDSAEVCEIKTFVR